MGLVELTIDELFAEAVRRFGPETALVYQADSYTWSEVDRLSDMLADRFAQGGVRHGDHVGLWGENSAAWIATFLALQKLGATVALLNSNYRRREVVQVMRIAEITWLFYGSTPALAEEPDLVEIAAQKVGESVRGLVDIREETLGLRRMLDGAPDYPGRRRESGLSCRDVACMLYTSGTTMEPKCALHDHYSLVNNAIVSAERTRMRHDDRICMSQPLFHVFALAAGFLAAVYCGATLYVLPHFGSEEILQCVQKHRCTILNGVPTNFLRLLSNPVFPRYRTDSLRLSVIGGAPLSEVQFDFIREAFPSSCIMTNYGLTEGCCVCNSEYSDDPRTVAHTVGRPYPYIEVAVQDPKTRRFLPPGGEGEVVVRGYSVMLGYYKPQSCDQPVDDEGWLHTEDLGVMDGEGHVSIVGRIKDIIIRGGEDITPAEIRKEILRYEPVLDALVIGAPHPILGEEVIACLVLEEPKDYNEQELRSMLRYRLAKYKIPAFFLLYDAFPLKPSGKVDMRALRADVYARVRVLHEGDERYNITPQQRA